MNDICIPMPRFDEKKVAEVEVRVEGKPQKFNFRLESFPWQAKVSDDEQSYRAVSEERMKYFREAIQNYDKNWELIQIYDPNPRAETIQVLFRQRVLI